MVAGCSHESTTPVDPPPPSLNSGYSFAEWALDGAACEEGQYCLDVLRVSQTFGDDPEIYVRVTGDSGTISQSMVISAEDYLAFGQLVTRVSVEYDYQIEGCVPGQGVSERVNVFEGDAGWGAGIEGCDSPQVLELRLMVTELVEKYFVAVP